MLVNHFNAALQPPYSTSQKLVKVAESVSNCLGNAANIVTDATHALKLRIVRVRALMAASSPFFMATVKAIV